MLGVENWPSKSAAILAMKQRGLTEGQIAKRLGIKPNTVSSMAVRAKRRQKRPVALAENVMLDLERAALRRGLTPHQLADRLLTEIVVANLIDAVLDDTP